MRASGFGKNLLACDTTQQACSVALLRAGDEEPICLYEEIGTGHTEHLPCMVKEALDRAGLRIAELHALGVTVGPGTFAGVRVGLAAMRAFALAGDLPIFTMTSLALMAQTYLAQTRLAQTDGKMPNMPLACVIDARRDQLYLQCFDADGLDLSAPAVLSVEQAVEVLADKNHVLIGTGAAVILAQLKKAGVNLDPYRQNDKQNEILYPDAAFIIAALQRGALAPTPHPTPLYLRPPDAALPKHDQRVKRK